MNTRSRSLRPCVAALVALMTYAGAVHPQPNPGPASSEWVRANDAVGRFLRGHIDILKAEQAVTPNSGPAIGSVEGPALAVDEAVRLALEARPDLAVSAASSEEERRIAAAEVAKVRLESEQAWLSAVAAQAQLPHIKLMLDGAAVAQELSARMVKVGNWGAERGAMHQMSLVRAQRQMLVSEQEAANAREALVRVLPAANWSLPARLPKLPELSELSELSVPIAELEERAVRSHPRLALLQAKAELEERAAGTWARAQWRAAALEAVSEAQRRSAAAGGGAAPLPRLSPRIQQLPHAAQRAVTMRAEADDLERTVRSQVRTARADLVLMHRLALLANREERSLYAALFEDAQQRYNGMFISTWDLIASAQSRSQGEAAAIKAVRDFWLARAALQGLLAGAPFLGVKVVAGDASAAASPAH